MGRASNRKKARLQAGLPAGRIVINIRAQARTQHALLAGLESVGRGPQSHEKVLLDVTKAFVSDNPAVEELAVLSRALDGTIPGVAGSVVADALIDAARLLDLRELPTEVLRQCPPLDNPLEILADLGVVAPGDVLRAGPSILAALVKLGEMGLASSSRQAAA